MTDLTFLDAERGARPAAGRVDGDRVLLTKDAVTELTGWVLKAEGLCRDEVCVPVRDPELRDGNELDARRLAAALGRPAVVDPTVGLVAFGAASASRRGPIEAGLAPDFTLPTLDGGSFTMSSISGRKRLLLAWASW